MAFPTDTTATTALQDLGIRLPRWAGTFDQAWISERNRRRDAIWTTMLKVGPALPPITTEQYVHVYCHLHSLLTATGDWIALQTLVSKVRFHSELWKYRQVLYRSTKTEYEIPNKWTKWQLCHRLQTHSAINNTPKRTCIQTTWHNRKRRTKRYSRHMCWRAARIRFPSHYVPSC